MRRNPTLEVAMMRLARPARSVKPPRTLVPRNSWLFAAALLLLFTVFGVPPIGAQQDKNPCEGLKNPLPSPAGPVNDYAVVIDEDSQQRLESRLVRLKKDSGIEFAVVTVHTTGAQNIFAYSLAVACDWSVGHQSSQREGGLLLLVAVKDRKWRVQVSSSLTSDLPDALVKQIGDRMARLFRQGKYSAGILRCVDEMIAELEKRRKQVTGTSRSLPLSKESGAVSGITRPARSFS